jgi:hypothetical protein
MGSAATSTQMMQAMMATSAISSVGGAYVQSQAMRAQGEHQENIAKMNAQLAEAQADQAMKRGQAEANRKEAQMKILRGRQRAAGAANGVDVDSGSMLEIQEESMALGALDAMTIKNNAIREAYGYKSQSMSYQQQGQWARSNAQMNADATLLTGGLNAINKAGEYYYLNSKDLDKSKDKTKE